MNIHLASVWMHKWFIHDKKNKASFDKLHIEEDYILMLKKSKQDMNLLYVYDTRCDYVYKKWSTPISLRNMHATSNQIWYDDNDVI